MQILRKTNLKGLKKAIELGSLGVINTLKIKGLVGRGGASFPTGKKWEFALTTDSDDKYVICNADEGEPGTFKDKRILINNPETLIEGILIASYTIKAKQAFIYLRGEYEYLEKDLQKVIVDVTKKSGLDINIQIVVGAGAYVCGDETAIIESISGKRGHPYFKPPFPPVAGLWGKPTVINNVETLTNVPQVLAFKDWNPNLRLFSLSGNIENPGVYEYPVGVSLTELIKIAKPKSEIKAIYFGCFGGCMPAEEILITPENVCGRNCIHGTFTLIFTGKEQSIVSIARNMADFYQHESCGKCTPCREGTKRIFDLLTKVEQGNAKQEDLLTLRDLSEQIHDTSLCGLGQTATNHVINALNYFKEEFEEKIK